MGSNLTQMAADELRIALRELGLSQREFAARLGVGPVTVHRWLSGALPVPRYAAYVAALLAVRDHPHPPALPQSSQVSQVPERRIRVPPH